MLDKRVTISDQIYNIIKNDILQGNFKFGDKIVEQEYTNRLKISRTPLREAIKKLEMEGIVERLPNGRLKIVELTIEQIKEIFQIRIALENMLLKSVIEDTSILEELEDNLKSNGKNIQEVNWEQARHDILTFSTVLYKNSRYAMTIKILKQHNFFLVKLKQNSLSSHKRVIQAYEEHKQMFEAIKQKNMELLQSINTTHLLHAQDTILGDYQQ